MNSARGLKHNEFQFINAFRALAAFWVVAAHCVIWTNRAAWAPAPKIAVDLFMVISGFLMAVGAADGSVSTAQGRWIFWLRRLFRIAPAYYASLALAVAASPVFLGGYAQLQALDAGRWPAGGVYDPSRIEYGAGNLLAHLTFVFGLHPRLSFSTFLPDWSLSLEMQFYAVFPLLWLALRRFGDIRAAVALTVPSIAIDVLVSRYAPFHEPSLLPFKVQYFLAGMLLFRYLVTRQKMLAWAAIALTALEPLTYWTQFLTMPALMALMILAATHEQDGTAPTWWRTVADSRLITFASDVSYGVYLFHGFFISACGWLLWALSRNMHLAPSARTAIVLALVLPASYAVGAAAHRWLERPGISLGRKVIARLRDRSSSRVKAGPSGA